jgi:hypothetical protein
MLFATREAPGVQSIEGELMRFLLEGTAAVDIDQVKAIPTLMIQDARAYGKPLPELVSYIADRAHWLVQISHDAGCAQKQAKTLVLSILFGGKYQTWLKKHGLELCDRSEAFGMITALQADIRRYVAWWDSAHADRVRERDSCTDEQLRAKGMDPALRRIRLLYQDLETKVTLVVKDALERLGTTARVLCHDGLIADCVESLDEASVRSLLRLCAEAVKQELGYDVSLELQSLQPTSGLSFEQYVEAQVARGDAPRRVRVRQGARPKPGPQFCGAHDCGDVRPVLLAAPRLRPRAVQLLVSRARGWLLGRGLTDALQVVRRALRRLPVRFELSRHQAHPRVPDAGLPASDPRAKDGPGAQLIPCAGGLYYDAARDATRPIDREHYVTKLWDLPPPTADSIAPEDLALFKETLEAVFPASGLYAAVVPLLAYDLLTVGSPHKGINFWIGDGDNGKTTAMKILKIAAPPGWIVSTRATNFTGHARGNEQPDCLIKLHGARLIYTEEPPKGELSSLDADWLKELRGDSDVSCHSIYGSEREMNVTFTLYCMADHVPHIEHLDEALKKSFVICELPGKFVDDPAAFRKANPYAPWKQYVKTVDRELTAKLSTPGARSALMHILCEQYSELVAQGAAAFAPVPEEFAKWKDEMPRVEDQLKEAFNCAYAIHAAVSEPVLAVRAANPELKINCQSLGAWMKRAFVDAKHEAAMSQEEAHRARCHLDRTEDDCSSRPWSPVIPVNVKIPYSGLFGTNASPGRPRKTMARK